MNNPNDPRDVSEPLTPEERALAERLASAAPQREPSAALDARILAAARAPATRAGTVAVGTDATTRAHAVRRQRHRWPAFAGLAATLALAFGLSWQLRPTDDVERSQSEAPRSPAAVRPARGGGPQAELEAQSDGAMADDATSAEPKARQGNADARQPTAATPADAAAPAKPAPVDPPAEREPTPSPPTGSRSEASKGLQETTPPVVFDQPSPVDTPKAAADHAASAPSPPPPPAPPAPTSVSPSSSASTPIAAPRTATPQGAPPQQLQSRRKAANRDDMGAAAAADAAAQPHARGEASAIDSGNTELDRVDVTGSRIDRYGDQPLDDQPPASASAPLVRDAWIKRIRQLRDQGEWDVARASLAEYRRRYPDAIVPDDLLPLRAP